MKKLILLALISVMFTPVTANAEAVGHANAGGHATAHASGGHASDGAHVTATHGETASHSFNSAVGNHASIGDKDTNIRSNTETSHFTKPSNYSNLSNTERSQWQSYDHYYSTYYPKASYSYYHNNIYFWCYVWNLNNHNFVSNYKQQAKIKTKTYWIKVGNKSVEVSQELYSKIKVGDKVELTDGHHLKINGQTYYKD